MMLYIIYSQVMVNRGLLYLSISDYHNALSDFRTARNVSLTIPSDL